MVNIQTDDFFHRENKKESKATLFLFTTIVSNTAV